MVNSSILEAIQHAYSGEMAKRHIAAITQYHRIQASPGYRQAASYVLTQLEEGGLVTELLTFPATEEAQYWSMSGFQEWACARATLDWLPEDRPAERLCDFQAVPISLIQRSAPVDGEFEVVVVENGTREAHYEGLDVAGKVVLTDGQVRRVYELAVKRHAAVGILFDGMNSSAPGRSPLDLPDARQYTSFWWQKGDPKCFGFVLTPRQGRRLRQAVPARVRAHVVSSFYDGSFEVVTAFIPGQTDEEVVVLSHLCHPLPAANDNASGAAANIEVAVTLHRLISEGQLAPPQRGIRFLWLPEMTGTYAYLSTYEDRLPRMVAGLNLDMVGQDQARCHSTFNIERPPESMASYAPVLAGRLWEMLMECLPAEEARTASMPVRYAVTPFRGGSDHYILSDPTVGVPTPMFIQWPDRFYHTSEDTLDKVDAEMLGRIGSLAAAYAYVVATAGERDVVWLGHEICTRRAQRLARLAQQTITAALDAGSNAELGRLYEDLKQAVVYRVDRDKAALRSLLRLWPGAQGLIAELNRYIDQAAQRELARAEAVCRGVARVLGADDLSIPSLEKEPWQERAARLVPERRYRGPLAFHSRFWANLSPAEQDELWEAEEKAGPRWRTACPLAEFWADGQHSIAEIAQRVRLEIGTDFGPQILNYFELLARHGLVTLHESLRGV